MPFTKEEHKAYREELRKQNICVRCHDNETEEGRATCSKCVDETLVQKREYRKDKTRCNECVSPLGEFDLLSNRASCPRCNEIKRMSKIRRRYEIS